MQENRSFDHYFGTMRGVRGFGRSAAAASRGTASRSSISRPARPSCCRSIRARTKLGMQFLQDLPHGWQDMHAAWNKGRYDQWVPNKGTTTMAYLKRDDIPFHYQLAGRVHDLRRVPLRDSELDRSEPLLHVDRLHRQRRRRRRPGARQRRKGLRLDDLSGSARAGRRVVEDLPGRRHGTRRERLVGLDAEPVHRQLRRQLAAVYFNQYRTALPGSPLYDKARTGTNVSAGGTLFDVLQQDVKNGTLPQVSWICAPEAYSEHPNWPANYGAWYIEQVLKTLVSNPDVWSKTALFITYDENDGFCSITCRRRSRRSRARTGCRRSRRPTRCSPATRRTWPARTGSGRACRCSSCRRGPRAAGSARRPSITRRCCNSSRRASVRSTRSTRPTCRRGAVRYAATSRPRSTSRTPTPAGRSCPTRAATRRPTAIAIRTTCRCRRSCRRCRNRSPRLRPARALPYELFVHGRVEAANGQFRLSFANTGRAGAAFQVQSRNRADGPWTYTVEAGKRLADTWSAAPSLGVYDLDVYGPERLLLPFPRVVRGGHRRESESGSALRLRRRERQHHAAPDEPQATRPCA
ncbi:Phospholipase C [Burkholderia dolosa AU0158]|nr:Phospholipase C [Burkholderia dolosa AU0158]